MHSLILVINFLNVCNVLNYAFFYKNKLCKNNTSNGQNLEPIQLNVYLGPPPDIWQMFRVQKYKSDQGAPGVDVWGPFKTRSTVTISKWFFIISYTLYQTNISSVFFLVFFPIPGLFFSRFLESFRRICSDFGSSQRLKDRRFFLR